jgi:DNA-binding IscR family transcriptional regulator
MAPVACLEDEVNQCEHYSTCPTIEVWEGLYEVVSNYLENITIGELAKKQKDRITGNGI